MSKETPFNDPDLEVVPYNGQWDLGQHYGSQLSDAIKLLAEARPILNDYRQMVRGGQVSADIGKLLARIEAFAVERRRCCSTGAHWRDGR